MTSAPKSSSPLSIAQGLTELWSPRVVAELDESYIKVAKVHGPAFAFSCVLLSFCIPSLGAIDATLIAPYG